MFQIIFLLLLAVIGMTIKQLPDFALRSATDYAGASGHDFGSRTAIGTGT